MRGKSKMVGGRVPATAFRCALVTIVLLIAATFSPSAVADGSVQPRFDLTEPSGGPFPSDRFTVPDPTQVTGLRVNLPKPDCALRRSDCEDIDVLNTLDGFNLQPRLSVPIHRAHRPRHRLKRHGVSVQAELHDVSRWELRGDQPGGMGPRDQHAPRRV
jgi:hypothetical protein